MAEIDFAGYQVIARIAARPEQTVFLARRRGLGRFAKLFCLKTFRSEHLADEDGLEEFLREAGIVTQLGHRYCVRVHEVGESLGVSYIAMEYVFGETFGEFMRSAREDNRALPTNIIVALVTAAAQGLHYAHQLRDSDGQPYGLVHRDISPSNLMLSYDGITKIIDFGAARIAQAVATRTGVIKGKTAYMAPEQLTGRSVDHRADIYSLGVILYEALRNERLYAGLSAPQIAMRVYKDAPPELSAGDYPAALADVVRRALARSPEGRFQTAESLAQALLEIRGPLEDKFDEEQLSTFLRQRFAERFEARQRVLQQCANGIYNREELTNVLELRPVLEFDLPEESEAKETVPPCASQETILPTAPTAMSPSDANVPKDMRETLEPPTWFDEVKEQKTELAPLTDLPTSRVPQPELTEQPVAKEDMPTAMQTRPPPAAIGIEPGPTRIVSPVQVEHGPLHVDSVGELPPENDPLADDPLGDDPLGDERTASVEIRSASSGPLSEDSMIANRRLQALDTEAAPSPPQRKLAVVLGIVAGVVIGVIVTLFVMASAP